MVAQFNLNTVPYVVIGLGAVLLVLCILSCVSVCSGQGKCAGLKFVLGVF